MVRSKEEVLAAIQKRSDFGEYLVEMALGGISNILLEIEQSGLEIIPDLYPPRSSISRHR